MYSKASDVGTFFAQKSLRCAAGVSGCDTLRVNVSFMSESLASAWGQYAVLGSWLRILCDHSTTVKTKLIS